MRPIRRAVFEALEARTLLSADLPPGPVLPDAARAQLAAEFRSLDNPAVQGFATEFTQAAMRASRQLVFVDPATPDFRSILDGLITPQADGRTVEVVLLDAERDGLRQISDALGARSNLDAVHIISQGDPGELRLGGSTLGFDALVKNAGKVKGWAKSLTAEAGIVLHGSEVTATEQGQALVAALAKLTGAEVSADRSAPGEALDASPFLRGGATADSLEPTGATTASAEIVFDELVIVDPNTPDFQKIVDDILAQRADGRVIEVLVLDPAQDGIAQVSAALAGRTGLDALHIVSHGDAGTIRLGETTLDFDSLLKSAKSIKGWGSALSGDADILIYGCDVASNADGRAFVDALARLTGADVAASEDLTGDAAQGGDWTLEYSTGAIEASALVTLATRAEWHHVLAPGVTVTATPGLQTTEAGGTVAFSVVLTEAPTANVVIPIASSDSTEGTASAASLTFTAANWNVAQIVTVTGRDDSASDGNVFYSIATGDVTSTDAGYDALAATDVADVVVTNVDNERVQSNVITLYTFEETSGATVVDRAGTALNLTINDLGNVTRQAGSITTNINNVGDPTIAESAAGINEVYTAIVASQQFTVEAWVQSSTTNQPDSVPHRLVTLSQNTNPDRNFTLAVADADESPSMGYVGRVRADAGDLNGSNNPVNTPTGSATLSLQHVVLTVDTAGNRTIYVDGQAQATVNTGPIDFSSWNSNYRLALFNEITRDRGWLGTMHLAAVYDRALTAAEIQRNFSAGADIHSLVVDTALDINDGDTSSIEALLNDRGADGFISLREAIIATNNTANAAGSPDRILFNIAGTGPHTLTFGSALPSITGAVIIDGTSEPDFSGTPVIVLDGNDLGASGLTLTGTADGSTIRGLVVRDFDGYGIYIESGSDGNTIAGNYIGSLTASGTDAGVGERNSQQGIEVEGANNVIGGTTAADRNVVAGNGQDGIQLWNAGATGNRIIGNYIGVDATGRTALGNIEEGVQVWNANNNVIGQAGAGNVIGASGAGFNGVGVYQNSAGTVIQGNWIGTNAFNDNLGNGYAGIDVNLGATGTTIGGIGPGQGNVIAYSVQNLGAGQPGTGVRITTGAGNSILGNSIYGNGGLGIDLVVGAQVNTVTANDAGDADAGANGLQNFPVLTSATTSGGFVTVVGSLNSRANQTYRIEYFLNPSTDPSEGRTFLGAITVTTDAGGNAAFTRSFGGGVVVNDRITATATALSGPDINSTSEFSAARTVTAAVAGTRTISGTVYEDVDGDADVAEAGTLRVAGATVYVYRDNGATAGQLDATDTLTATGITDASGNYGFTGLASARYWVVVDSRTIAPASGFNTGFTFGDAWAEQTYAAANAATSASTFTAAAGAFYGGMEASSATSSDNVAGGLLSAEHVIRADATAANVSGVDFGFSFNVVTNLLAGDNRDDYAGAGNDNTVQGSFRQFIQNANAAVGANTMRFVPTVAANVTSGANSWWQLTVSSSLPQILDQYTVIDGTAYQATVNGAVRDTNLGTIGYSGQVGLGADVTAGTADDPIMAGIGRPELELLEVAAGDVDRGIDIQASNVTVRALSMRAFGSPGDIFNDASIWIGANGGGDTGPNYTGILIEDNVLGWDMSTLTLPAETGTQAIAVFGPDDGIIRRNAIAYQGWFGAFISNDADRWTITRNDFRENALSSSAQDSLDVGNLASEARVVENYFYRSNGGGFDSYRSTGGNLIENNTFESNGLDGSVNVNAEDSAIRLYGSGSAVRLNRIINNIGPGVLVVSADTGPPNVASTGNVVSQNSFSGNGGNAIDLVAYASAGPWKIENNRGDGPTANDGGTNANAGNLGRDYPVITSALKVGADTVVRGTTGAGFTVEVYIATAGTGDGGGLGFGEGSQYLGTVTADAGGNFTLVSSNASIVAGTTRVTSIAIDGFGNTSEFSQNVTVAASTGISGTIWHDVDADANVGETGTLAFAGATVRLYSDAGTVGTIDGGDTLLQTTTTNALGQYAFTGLTAGANYWVVVDSKTLAASGYNAGFTSGDVWAEQTYGDGWTTAGIDLAARYGGRSVATSDNAAALATSEHVARVSALAAAGVADLDYGFSFSAIVSNRGDDGDDDGANARLQQGTLRQFVLNSNAIAGVQTSEFQIGAVGSAQSIGLTGAGFADITDAVVLDAWTQGAAGYNGAPLVEVNGVGTSGGYSGFNITSSGSTIRGFVINRFDGSAGIQISGNDNVVVGNYLGLNAAGNAALGNANDGIRLSGGALNNRIGGTGTGERNVVSGNNDDGISLDGASNTLVIGNYVGLNAAGTAVVANVGDGVVIQTDGTYGSANNRIGGLTAAERNVIAGNATNVANGLANVRVRSTAASPIGGMAGNQILGNYIGTDASGTVALANPRDNVLVDITNGVVNTVIGGAATGAGNVIGGSTLSGIRFTGSYSLGAGETAGNVYGNYIGTDASATVNLGNAQYGIWVEGTGTTATSVQRLNIGGTAAGQGNTIRNSGFDGVAVSGNSYRITIVGNSIYANGQLGIDLIAPADTAPGVTANDIIGNDGDTGANTLQNFPAFTANPITNGTTLTVSGTLTSVAGGTYTIHFYASATADGSGNGEGQRYLGSHTAVGAGPTYLFNSIVIAAPVAAGEYISMTATNAQGDTSEFSVPIAARTLASISGRIYEDVNGDGSIADGVGRAGVDVQLWRDANGNNRPDAGDTVIASTVTNASGDYTFSNQLNDTYWIIVDSRDIAASAGYNGALTLADSWAEQTYASVGGATYDGTNYSFAAAAGALFGGLEAGGASSSDNFAVGLATTGAEHLTRVALGAANVSGVDFGFSFQAVTNARDGDDDGGSAPRSVQGSLRQFIQNANSIVGTQTSAFVIGAGGAQTITLASALPIITQTVNLNGTTQAGFVSAPIIEVSGNGVAADGFVLSGAGANASLIRGFVLNRFTDDNVLIINSSNNVVAGNYIGTNAAGTADQDTGGDGVQIEGTSTGNTVGGTVAADRNVISGNAVGVRITGDGADSNRVWGNYIGTNAAGAGAVANSAEGVRVEASADLNAIGGTNATYRNVISGNTGNGVTLTGAATDTNDVRWNYIGIDAAGTATLGNGGDGILIADGSRSGNVYDNTIGGNQDGIQIDGTTASQTAGNIVRSNYVGTDSTLTLNFGNAQNGLRIVGANAISNNIGGNGTVLGNWFWNNAGDGIRIESSASGANRLEINRAFNNGGLGINLVGGAGENAFGVTPNDAAPDADTGANGLSNYPVFTSASWNGSSLGVVGTITGKASTTYRINFYVSTAADASGSGEGQYYAGAISVATNAAGAGSFSTGFAPGVSNNLGLMTFGAGSVVTASAWDPSDESSEYSAAFPITIVLPGGTATGTVYNDVNADAAVSGGEGVFANATVRLYRDDGDNTPDAGDTYVTTTTTDASGNYSLSSNLNGTYWVIVDSRSLTLAAGQLNGGAADQDNIWAEQTRGDDSTTAGLDVGARFGGRAGATADNPWDAGNLLVSPEHVARVTFTNSNTTSAVDFGFSFNAVTNTRGDNTDLDATSDRLQQGSLRQFILNANAITGVQTSQFRLSATDANHLYYQNNAVAGTLGAPVVTTAATDAAILDFDPDYPAGTARSWWSIQPTGAILPSITDAVVLDGTTQSGFSAARGPIIELNGVSVGGTGVSITNGGSGTTVRGLVINRFNDGIYIDNSANNIVEGSYIGTDVSGTLDRGNTDDGIDIFDNGNAGTASNNRIGGTGGITTRNVISGNNDDGIVIGDAATAANNLIVGNYIGTNSSGTADLGNGLNGVRIRNGATLNTIGGTTAAERNVISGNDSDGVNIASTAGVGNAVRGNYIGTNAAGTAAIANSSDGVEIASASQFVGGTGGAGNLISGNTGYGIYVNGAAADNNTIQGNYIGTNAAGTAAVGNGSAGIWIADGAANQIGGTAAGAGNLVSGNGAQGIVIGGANATGNIVEGNYVGTNAAGTAALQNNSDGITVWNGADNTRIGGPAAGAGNVISGNRFEGVYIYGAGTTGTIVQGNRIGTNAAGTAGIANGNHGVLTDTSATNTLIGGANAGEGNVIAYNTLTGITVSGAATTAAFLSNVVFANGGQEIDLGGDGITANDPGDADAGANNLQNFPTATSFATDGTTLSVVNLTVDSNPAGTWHRIDFFANTANVREAQRYLGSIAVQSGNVFTGALAGLSAVAAGEYVTMTATRSGVAGIAPYTVSSELSAPIQAAPLANISGTIYEDVNGDANLADAVGRSGVTVRLFRDDGDNTPDAGDTYVTSVVTGAGGAYTFANQISATYWVVVDSKTVTPNAGVGIANQAWAEQTYGVAGALSSSGTLAASGALFGGRSATGSDSSTNAAASLGASDHVTRVALSGSDATGIDSAFSFNVVTNVDGDGSDDDGGATPRLSQGSLHQFILNANAITGANAMRFVPAVAATSGGGTWWTIDVTSALPSINDADTTLDGTAYSSTDGVTVVNSNAGQVGTGGTVGVDALTLDRVNRAELELRGGNLFAGAGIDINAGNAIVRNFAINGFGALFDGDQIRVGSSVTGASGQALITGNLIGVRADGSLSATTEDVGIRLNGAATITNNYIAYVNNNGVMMSDAWNGTPNTQQVNFINNEVAFTSFTSGTSDAVSDIANGAVIRGNYIHDYLGSPASNPALGKGIEVWYQAQGVLIENNTIASMRTAGIGINDGASNNTIRRNVITGTVGDGTADSGAGILITSFDDAPPANGAPSGNFITENSIYGNAGLGIDIDIRTGAYPNAFVGDGVTMNDGLKTGTSGNVRMDQPVFSTSTLSGTTLTVTGYVGSAPGQATFANVRVEIFRSSIDPGGYGEGQTFLGFLTTDANGNFSGSLTVSGLAVGNRITGTATDAANNTSEFGVNSAVTSGNTAPVNTVPATRTVNEDTPLAFAGANTISVADAQTNVVSTALSVTNAGTLTVTLQGAASISAGGNGTSSLTISGTQADINATLATLTYQGASNFNGAAVLTVTSTDGGGLQDTDACTITVNPVNDAPTSTNDSVTTAEDTAVVLTVADFGGYSDVEGTPVASVQITSLATDGQLQYDTTGTGTWAAVALNQVVSAADIAAGRLRFVPDANENGSPYATIGFRVSDRR